MLNPGQRNPVREVCIGLKCRILIIVEVRYGMATIDGDGLVPQVCHDGFVGILQVMYMLALELLECRGGECGRHDHPSGLCDDCSCSSRTEIVIFLQPPRWLWVT